MTGIPVQFRPCVVLAHEFSADPSRDHFDWLIETVTVDGGDADERSLVSFRVPSIPMGTDDFDAVRLPAHRRHYLTYEGPVPGDRGTIRRVWTGEASIEEAADSISIVMRTHAADPPIAWLGVPLSEDRWRFTRATDIHRTTP